MSLPVSFLSDFGRKDEFVGVVHGVVARIAPEVRVLDVTHEVAPGDVRSGALTLLRAVQYMPEGVMLAVVDPGVGTERKAIVAETAWGFFVGPDNGLLAPAVAMVGGASKIVAIENPELRLPSSGETFHGRDLFGPAAAVLASGQATIDEIGPSVPADSVTPLMIPLVEQDEGAVRGEVLWVDGFGNAQTNITPDDLDLVGITLGSDVVLRIGAIENTLVYATAYGDVEIGEGMVHVDSYGQIAVAVRQGRAVDDFPLEEHIAVTLRSATSPVRIQGVSPVS
jgi:S-adenosylmethionine hydrolase